MSEGNTFQQMQTPKTYEPDNLSMEFDNQQSVENSEQTKQMEHDPVIQLELSSKKVSEMFLGNGDSDEKVVKTIISKTPSI